MYLSLQSAVLLVLLSFAQSQTDSEECLSNKECPDDRLCAEYKCINPCLLNVCANPVDCKVTNHIPVCACSSGFAGPLSGGSVTKKGAKRFRIYKRKKNWFGALINCTTQGMALATITTQEEQNQLVDQLKKEGGKGRYWLGGTDLHEEDDYIWFSTGKQIEFNNFRPGEPSDSNGRENCLEIVYGNVWNNYDWNYEWNDTACSEKVYYICEYYK